MPSSAFACLYFTFFLAALGRHCCRWTSSSCSEWGLLLITAHRLLTGVASLGAEHRLQARGPQQLQHTGLLAPWHVGSSWPRDQTRVPCSGRWILNHWTTRDVPISPLFLNDFFLGCQFFPQHFEDVILLSSTTHIFFGKVHFNLIIASLNVMSLLYDFKIFYSLNLNSLTKICL